MPDGLCRHSRYLTHSGKVLPHMTLRRRRQWLLRAGLASCHREKGKREKREKAHSPTLILDLKDPSSSAYSYKMMTHIQTADSSWPWRPTVRLMWLKRVKKQGGVGG